MNGRAIPGANLFRLYVSDKKWADHITQGRPTNPTGLFTFEIPRSETPDNITFRLTKISANECDSGTNYLREPRYHCILKTASIEEASPRGCTVYGVGLRPIACCDCSFESRRRRGYLSFVIDVCCVVGVSASVWSLVQRSLTEYGISECDREGSTMRRLWPTGGCCEIKR
jgi:hypothetical protein